MKEYNSREMRKVLRDRGYAHIRTKGSHEIWVNGSRSVVLPAATLKVVIAHKLLKQTAL